MSSALGTFVLSVAAVVATASANQAPAGHQYQAPGPNDVRSPCPGLNSLANHGFLPRTGQGMTIPILIQGLADGVNVGADFATAAGAVGILSNPDPLATSFDLDMLDEHNFPIEHDGSLSREDYYEGNDHSFNQTIFNQILQSYNGMTTATIPVASKARYNRIENARAANPTFTYGVRQFVLSYGETALYLSAMGNPVTGDAPISYIKSFFEKEELPYNLGWTKPTIPITFATLGAMAAELQLANPNLPSESLTLGAGSLRDVFSLINPLTDKAENATCILAGTC